MRKYLFIIAGGMTGAIIRYVLKDIKIIDFKNSFPINTLLINIIGSFLLAIIITMALKGKKFDEDLRLGITTGFLGAFTTFSTFAKETESMCENSYIISAGLYVLLSVLLGLAAAGFGVYISKKWIKG